MKSLMDTTAPFCKAVFLACLAQIQVATVATNASTRVNFAFGAKLAPTSFFEWNYGYMILTRVLHRQSQG